VRLGAAWPPDDDAAVLVSSLARSLRAANLSDLASVLAATEPAEWADRFLDALSLLELLDLLALRAQAAGEVDEAARLVQRAIDAEPYDEERYVRLAGLFTSQGRVGSARAVLRRARAMLDDLGLPASGGVRAAERAAGESEPGPGP
jgi:DNA-binding SARP family transcriptional activator